VKKINENNINFNGYSQDWKNENTIHILDGCKERSSKTKNDVTIRYFKN
jgi:hypothetical protein